MKRFAIYYAPHLASPLWEFGSSVLGYDAAAAMEVDYPAHPVFQDPAALAWTAAPRRYGFHATLKAPFQLASGRTEQDLARRLERFCESRERFSVTLKLASIENFLALVLAESCPRMERLAEECVRDFDDLRAPMSASERERRHPDRLHPRALENLDRWGYPFVFDDFRFHITLTGPMTLDDQIRLAPVIEEMLALIPLQTVVDALCLFAQDDAESRFKLVSRYPFKAA